jgi:hypothetical protein
MKRHVLRGAFALTFAYASPLLGQELSQANPQLSGPPKTAGAFNTGTPIQPLVGISPDSFSKDQPWYVVQDPASLGFSEAPTVTRPYSLASQLRKNAAPFLKAVDKTPDAAAPSTSRRASRELNFALALLTAMYQADVPSGGDSVGSDLEFALNIRQRIHADPSKLLEIVADAVTTHPDRVCEVVKAAIRAVNNDEQKIPQIVEAAAIARPDAMRLAAQCAVASVPDSLASVQAVLAKLDPAGGDRLVGSKSGKDSKDAKEILSEVAPVVSAFDPLALPPPPPPITPPPPPPPATDTRFRAPIGN